MVARLATAQEDGNLNLAAARLLHFRRMLTPAMEDENLPLRSCPHKGSR